MTHTNLKCLDHPVHGEVEVEVEYETEQCECSSTAGDGRVTERWSIDHLVVATCVSDGPWKGEVSYLEDKSTSEFDLFIIEQYESGNLDYD